MLLANCESKVFYWLWVPYSWYTFILVSSSNKGMEYVPDEISEILRIKQRPTMIIVFS